MSPQTKTWLLFGMLLAAGAGAILLALLDLVPLIVAVESSAPIIALLPGTVIGLPIGVGLLALAAVNLLPARYAEPERNSRRKAAPRRFDWPALLFGAAVLSFISASVAPFAVNAFLGSLLEQRGYLPCPTIKFERHAQARWARVSSVEMTLVCPH